MTEPLTEAGRAHARWWAMHGDPLLTAEHDSDIRAIEAEATAAERARIAPLVECPHCDVRHEWPCPTIQRCDEPGCDEEATCGWPSRPGGTGLNGGYRRTCGPHMWEAHDD